MFDDLFKAVVSTVVLPAALVKDVVTLGGATTGERSAVASTLENIEENIKNATKPRED